MFRIVLTQEKKSIYNIVDQRHPTIHTIRIDNKLNSRSTIKINYAKPYTNKNEISIVNRLSLN